MFAYLRRCRSLSILLRRTVGGPGRELHAAATSIRHITFRERERVDPSVMSVITAASSAQSANADVFFFFSLGA